MTTTPSVCSLSVDLDNKWSYMKTHADPGWETFPSYLDLVVPRILKMLDRFDWKITVFVVGQDAALGKNQEALRMVVDAGHEIANHSFNHEPWLHLYSKQEIDVEINRAETAIEAATGKRPCGFRGPGYSLSRATLEVLADHNYVYDASTLPTFLGPLARAYYFMASRLSRQERSQRRALFGKIRDGLRPIRPYRWNLGTRELLEIPVTTMPFLRFPIHFSYTLYIATFSPALAHCYFRNALTLCRLTGTQPSLLLHPLDFLSADDAPEVAFFPTMKLSVRRKLDLLYGCFSLLSQRFEVVGMADHARKLQRQSGLAEYSPERMKLSDQLDS